MAELSDYESMVGHTHLTRDIKDEGQCPACDRHHAMAKRVAEAKAARVFCRSCGNRSCLPDPFDCAMKRIASMSEEIDELVAENDELWQRVGRSTRDA